MYIPEQGDIVLLNFDPQTGHEQKGRRPALVISNLEYNLFTKAAIVCPIANTNRGIPIQCPLDDRTKTPGVIMCEQLKALDIVKRNAQFLEKLPKDLLEEVIDIVSGFVEIL